MSLNKNLTNNMPHVDASGKNLEVSYLLAYSSSSPELMKNFSREHEIGTTLKTKILNCKDFFLLSNSKMLYLSYS